jgi:hypothetical protein
VNSSDDAIVDQVSIVGHDFDVDGLIPDTAAHDTDACQLRHQCFTYLDGLEPSSSDPCAGVKPTR